MTTPAHQRAMDVASSVIADWLCHDEPDVAFDELNYLSDAVAAALETEIEACAKVADARALRERGQGELRTVHMLRRDEAQWIASAVRDRQRKGAR